jgi:hypothetical protein
LNELDSRDQGPNSQKDRMGSNRTWASTET